MSIACGTEPDGLDPRYTVQYAAAEALARKPDTRPGISIEMTANLLFGRPRARAEARPSMVLATISSRRGSAGTGSMPVIARPSIVPTSIPCSITRRPPTFAQDRPEGDQVQD
ncbi:hypothetical protein GCM10020216_099590 [Nonomuraea helvata]